MTRLVAREEIKMLPLHSSCSLRLAVNALIPALQEQALDDIPVPESR